MKESWGLINRKHHLSEQGGIMIIVEVKDINRALKTFKSKVKKRGLIKEMKNRRYHKTPSEIKHEKNKKIKALAKKNKFQAKKSSI